jgi:hypothetical protein
MVDTSRNRYLFKITVVGPEDKLLADVLKVFNEHVIAIDGIRIGSGEMETDSTDVRVLLMSPKHSAMDLLLSMTYKGASGVIIVMRDADPEIETVYRNEIRESVGEGIPTRVVTVGSGIDKYKRNEIALLFEEIIEEILASKKH